MRIIPVVDVKAGVVVHACGGDRGNYRPIVTPLADSARPVEVVRGLKGVCQFATLYVADLDAIAGAPPDLATLNDVAENFPDLEIWLDAGRAIGNAMFRSLAAAKSVRPVIGTESLSDGQAFAALRDARVAASLSAPILSLDHKGGRVLGADLSSMAALWPDTVIVMMLDAVGARSGPDVGRIAEVRARARPGTTVVAAGGVRDARDLRALTAAGADAALIATALHAGTLKAGDLDEIAGLPLNSKCS